tara:strand:- start:3475 stop:4167 length:693 start_codon:yes stop_codon:yes gene_type:complete
MARKKLLSEGEIRQFMKLAQLRPLGQQRLSELEEGGMHYAGDRDVEEDDPMMGDAPVDADAEVDEVPPEDDLPGADDDVGPELAEPAEEGEVQISDEEARRLIDALEAAEELRSMIEDALGGPEAGAEMGDMMGADDEMAADDEMGADDVAAVDEPAPMPVEDEEDPDAMMEEISRRVLSRLQKSDDSSKQDKVVAEVSKRVARRLEADKRKDELADQLAERIMKRLTNK